MWVTEFNGFARFQPMPMSVSLGAPARVFDGLIPGQEQSYALSSTSLRANWPSVASARGYDLALGVTPFDTSLRPWTSVGNTTSATVSLVQGVQMLSTGRYYVSVRAEDSANLPTGATTSAGVALDTIAPTVSIIAPTQLEQTNKRVLSTSAFDGQSGLQSIQFQRSPDSTAWTNIGSPFNSTGGSVYTLNPTAVELPEGFWYIRAVATDQAGNTGVSAGVPFTLDTTPPAAPMVLAPAGATSQINTSVTIAGSAEVRTLIEVWRASDLPAGSSVPAVSAVPLKFNQLPAGVGNFSLVVPLQAGVVNNLTVSATDVAGNRSIATAVPPITQQVVACTDNPAVRLSAVADGQGGLVVTVNARNAGAPITSIQFGASSNAVIAVGGLNAQPGSFTYTPPGGALQVNFVVHRLTPGVATTVPMQVFDGCPTSPWTTFVGGGPGAF
jgi:hypothetical protein